MPGLGILFCLTWLQSCFCFYTVTLLISYWFKTKGKHLLIYPRCSELYIVPFEKDTFSVVETHYNDELEIKVLHLWKALETEDPFTKAPLSFTRCSLCHLFQLFLQND